MTPSLITYTTSSVDNRFGIHLEQIGAKVLVIIAYRHRPDYWMHIRTYFEHFDSIHAMMLPQAMGEAERRIAKEYVARFPRHPSKRPEPRKELPLLACDNHQARLF